MKWVFLAVAAVLTVASGLIWLSLPDTRSEKPVIYWVTDANPARKLQVDTFQEWLARTHPGVEVELRLDMGNNDNQKKIMQGVSGIGGDIQDLFAGINMRFFRELGVTTDITAEAAALGFGPDQTYDAILEDITIEGTDGVRRQYQFPCNVASSRLYVNEELLSDADGNVRFPYPPRDGWTVEEFEEYGTRWVEWANRPENKDTRRRRFLLSSLQMDVLQRGFGIDLFNETLTGPGLDQYTYTADGLADYRGFVEALRLRHRWTHVLRLIPSETDMAAMSTGGGYGGAGLQAFERGDFLLFEGGRYHLIQFRASNKLRVETGREPLRLGSIPAPYKVLQNSAVAPRAAAIYYGSPHRDLAAYFLQFLASEAYNALIVHDADGMPPNPVYTDSEAFLRPAEQPELGIYPQTEWGVHEAYRANLMGDAISRAYSPFLLYTVAQRERGTVEGYVMSNADLGFDAAADQASSRIRRLFKEAVSRMDPEDPRRAQFAELTELQRRIDARKEAGRKIPRSWIKNVFYERYYEHIGMIEEDEMAAETEPTMKQANANRAHAAEVRP